MTNFLQPTESTKKRHIPTIKELNGLCHQYATAGTYAFKIDGECILVEIGCGDHIPVAIQTLWFVARHFERHGHYVQLYLKANGVLLIIDHTNTPEMYKEEFSRRMKEASANHPKREPDPNIPKMQHRMASLVGALDHVLKDERLFTKWLIEFTELGDHIAVKFDNAAIAQKLEDAGYVQNEFVGADFKAMTEEENREKAFRWAVGQAIDMLKMPMPVHPGLASKFEKHLEGFDPALESDVQKRETLGSLLKGYLENKE